MSDLDPRFARVRAQGGEGVRAAGSLLRERFERILAVPSPAVWRLSYARTSVAFQVENDGTKVTLLLDRQPPALAYGSEPAEVEIVLTTSQVNEFCAGELALAPAILRGALPVRGPVRKYLEVDPILRVLLRNASGQPAGQNGHRRRKADDAPHLSEISPELLAIETRDVHKRFGRHRVLRGVDLKIPEGAVSIVLGPSGTGKSVLLQHVIGLMRPDHGEVLVRGRPLGRMSRSELMALRASMGVMFQDGALFSAMSVYDNVAFPLRQHTSLRESQIREVVMERLAAVGLADAARTMPNQLSGGMRKRAGLARALVLDPGVLLCDEPDSGLDPVRAALLGDLLLEQHAQLGGTIIVITHDVALAKRISDHISILWNGQVLESGLTQEILASDTDFVRQFLAGETQGPLGMD